MENVELPTLLVGGSRRRRAAPGDGAARAARCGRAGRPPPPPTVGRRAAARRGCQGPGQRAAGGARRRATGNPDSRATATSSDCLASSARSPGALIVTTTRVCQYRRPAAHHAGRSNRGADAAGRRHLGRPALAGLADRGASADELDGLAVRLPLATAPPPGQALMLLPTLRSRRACSAWRCRSTGAPTRPGTAYGGRPRLPRHFTVYHPPDEPGRALVAELRHRATHSPARPAWSRPAAPGATCTGRFRSTAAQRTSPPRCAIPAPTRWTSRS